MNVFHTTAAVLCAAILFSACSAKEIDDNVETGLLSVGTASENAYSDVTEMTEALSEITSSALSETNFRYTLDRTKSFDPSTAEENGAYLLASLPESDIWLYGIIDDESADRVVIEHSGTSDEFDQCWLTPRSILPQLSSADYDDDGISETAVSYYIGSGTGVSCEELVVYSLNADGHYSAYTFDAESLLFPLIRIEVSPSGDSITYAETLSGESFTDKLENGSGKSVSAAFGTYIGYSFDGDKIKASFAPAVMPGMVFSDISLTADIHFDGTAFSADNIDFITDN